MKVVKQICIYTVFWFLSTSSFGQSINTSFGKNRIQFHDDFNSWKQYETENFLVYWYGKGDQIAHAVIQMAELDHDDIQQLVEHRINDKIEIVVYLDMTDLKQTNIGYEEAFSNQTGKTKIFENKMFVHFNGDHRHLRRQIREGIASVYLNSILAGSNLQEIVQNAILLDLPDWFREGMISYVGSRWDYELDDELRDIFYQTNEYLEFKKLEKDHARITGHSLWYYIDLHYGKSAIANILYLTRINRNLESSFLYVLNKPFEKLVYDWEDWVFDYYENEKGKFDSLSLMTHYEIKKKDYVPISLLKLSPNGKKLLYADNQLGKYKMYVLDIESGERRLVFKLGTKNNFQATDYFYPIAAWHPDGNEITYVYESRDIIYIRKQDLDSGEFVEQTLPENAQRIYSVDYWDENRYVFSGSVDGYSDLLMYNTKGRKLTKITDDFYDDLESVVVKDEHFNGVLFRSNRKDETLEILRLDTILPVENFDFFYLDLSDENKPILQNLSNTPLIDEQQLQYTGGGSYTYLSARNGILNVYFERNKEAGKAISNYNRNIILHSSSRSKHAFVTYHAGAYKLYIENHPDEKVTQDFTALHTTSSREKAKVLFPVLVEEEADEYPGSWAFQSIFEDPPNVEELFIKEEEKEQTTSNYTNKLPSHNTGLEKIIPERASPSRLTFKKEDVTVKMDNTVLFEGLESYVNGESALDFTSMGLLVKGQVKDLYEDYILEVGLRIPVSFNGTEYFVSYDNNKKLIDKRLSVYRKSTSNNVVEGLVNGNKVKTKTLLAQYRWKLPFSIYRSVRATVGLRNDKQFLLSADDPSLNSPLNDEKRISLKLEYVYDNTIDVDLNIKSGTRYKFYTEAINEFDLRVIDGFSFDVSKGFTAVVGYDARHYISIGRYAVFASRSAGATSLGSNKILYYLGGTENDLLRGFDQTTPTPSGSFAYQTPAPHLRGFDSNIRNGSSYLLANAELRFPVFKMLGLEKIRFALIRNLQLTTFFDAGLAWHGSGPFSEGNPLNILTLENPPVVNVTIQYFRDPLIMSYGLGMRTTLFGYLLRVDYGWGIETRQIQDPKLHIALGVDF